MSTGENAKRRSEADESQRLKDAAGEDRRKRIIYRFKQGDAVKAIAAGVGRSANYVRTVLREAGMYELQKQPAKRKPMHKVISDVRRGAC